MVDEIDEKILALLEENARMTYVEIGNLVGLSEGAVRNRIQSMVSDNVIKRFTIEKAISQGVRALTMIAVEPGIPTFEVSQKVNKLDGVERIYEVTGEYDIVMVSHGVNIEHINKVIEDIRKIKGVEKTNTIIVLRTIYNLNTSTMKKFIIPVILVLIVIGAYVAFNRQPGIPDDLSDNSDEPTGDQSTEPPSTTDETPTESETPTLEYGLKGVSFSPRNYTGEGIIDFFTKAPESNDLITWVGDWVQLDDSNTAPYLAYGMRSLYGYEALVITAYIDQGSGVLLRPLDEETKQQYLDSAVSFTSTYKPRYMGFGVEMNIVEMKNSEAYEEFKAFYPTVYDAVKEVSPDTLVFTVWQLEHMKGLDGGLFGGVNDPDNAQWSLLDDFESDISAFTLYPCLIYGDPQEIPDDYLTEIAEHTDKPIAFTEMGWFREGFPGWESSPEEQAAYIDRYFELSASIDPVFTIWSFYYDQATFEPFSTMGLLDVNMTETAGLDAWSSH